MQEISRENQLLTILKSQDQILDCMLREQDVIHECVRNRTWNTLESSLSNMETYSDAFVKLDDERMVVSKDDSDMYFLPEIAPVLASVRTKLTRSKIENEALSSYVHATQDFLDEVLEECVPQERNTLYTNKGYLKKPERQSLLVNRLF